jgi:3-isopropylmalate/(R)-2-methylmalate dehydratase small subunit
MKGGIKMMIKGNAHLFGDNIDTDVIIPARYLNTFDQTELARHCMEDIDKDFSNKVQAGDIIVAGKNFGCGSSREHAPIAIKGSGVGCVIAESFARIFYRNAINVGLPILECPEMIGEVAPGDSIEVDTNQGVIINHTTGKRYQTQAFPPFIQSIIDAGGEIEYLKQKMKG